MSPPKYRLMALALIRRRRLLAALAAGIYAFELLIAVIVGTIPTETLLGGLGPEPPQAMEAFTGSGGAVSLMSVEGIVGAGLVHPFWLAVQTAVVCSFSAAVMAADIEAGTIELVAVRPVSRLRIFGERTAALVLAILVTCAASTAGLMTGWTFTARFRDVVSLGSLAVAGLLGACFALSLAGPCLIASAIGRTRAQVIAVGTGLMAVGFAVNFLALAWDPARPSRFLSPLHYYRPADAVATGALHIGDVAVLLGVFGIGLATAMVLVQHRDLT